MLVLTRKKQESIAIGGLNDSQPMVTVTVLDIIGGRVRLGFEGDPNVFIHRSELWERIRAAVRPKTCRKESRRLKASLLLPSARETCMADELLQL